LRRGPAGSKGSRINLGGPLYAPLGEFQFNPNDKTAERSGARQSSIAGARTHQGGVSRWVRPTASAPSFARGIFTFNGKFTGSVSVTFCWVTSGRFSTVHHWEPA
jgi:hypothetical protein